MKCYMIKIGDGKYHCRGKSKTPAIYFNIGHAKQAASRYHVPVMIEIYEMDLHRELEYKSKYVI